MPTVLEIVQRLFPAGTRPADEGSPSWTACPEWAPDIFAVAATLVDRSGYYATARCMFSNADGPFGSQFQNHARIFGEQLRNGDPPSAPVEDLWKLVVSSSARVENGEGPWLDAALSLLAIADEACAGVGFVPDASAPLPNFVLGEYYQELKREPRRLPHLPHSLCIQVDPGEAVVQPKASTPEVGCTLRSLSRHLCLLPPIGEVRTTWRPASTADDQSLGPLNLLVIPFPYRIDGSSFEAMTDAPPGVDPQKVGFFRLRHRWVPQGGAARIADLLNELIRRGRDEVGRVHGVVVPEGALPLDDAREVAHRIAREGLELFISGVSQSDERARPRNEVYVSLFNAEGMALAEWRQSKHHRWRLDGSQIRRYHLGHELDPAKTWWELIDIGTRQCWFYVFRPGASLAALVCEDLARIDPVQTVIRSVGPSLVIALLMDGPQLERRWPGRYATVLADDPGSAVLTLTSLGMVRRSSMPGNEGPSPIALWKDPYGQAQELLLPRGAHALVLTLSASRITGVTLDGRSDASKTVRLSLSGVREVRLTHPDAWLDCGIAGW